MFIGIEIGGTKLQIGLGAGDGVMARLWRGPVDVAAGGDGIRRQIVAAVPELLNQAGVKREQLRGIGVGFGGPVDDHTQTIVKSHQIRGWDNFPLARWLNETLTLPVALGNDADVAGLAEASFGAGKGLSPVFYMTVGSGIGGGLTIDGRIHRGAGRGAAEIGHLRVRKDDGRYDIVEHVASGWGMEAEARRHGENWTAVQIAAEARRDPLARAIIQRAIDTLAEALCHVIALVCPKRIVIGGGVSLMGDDLFFAPLRAAVAEREFAPFAGLTEIVPAALGEEVVVHGALALARQGMRESRL
jgi:glucokinase